jgi:hypothetical protein
MLVTYTDAASAHLPKEKQEYVKGLHRRHHETSTPVTKETKDNLMDTLRGPPAQEKGQDLVVY